MLYYWRKLLDSLTFRPRRRKSRRPPPRRLVTRHAYRPRLEALEDRAVPAIVSYNAGADLLQFLADAGDTDAVMVTAPVANQVRIEVGNGDTIVLAGDAAPPDFVLSDGDTVLTINTANAPVALFDVDLGDQDDTLAFSLVSIPNGVTNVDIDGGAGSDTVTAGPLTAGGTLAVAADAIQLTGAITTGDSQTYTGAAQLLADTTLTANGAGSITFGGTLDAGANSLTLTAAEVDFNGGPDSVSGTAAIALRPNADATPIVVGALADAGAGSFDVTDADIAALANGFTLITVGRATGTGTITVDASGATFKDAVTLRAPGMGGAISVDGQFDTVAAGDAGAITLDGPGATTTLNADVVTAGADIVISDSVILGTPMLITLDTTNGGAVAAGANVSVAGTVDDDTEGTTGLVINAGTGGTVTLGDAVGGTAAPTSIQVTGLTANVNGTSVRVTNDQTYDADVTVAAATAFTSTGVGTIAFNGMLTAGANALTVSAREINFNGGANSVTGTASVTLQPEADATGVVVGGAADSGAATLDVTDADIAALAEGFTLVTIGRAAATGTVTVDASGATFKDALTLRAPGMGGAISVDGTLATTGSTLNNAAASITLDGPGATTTLNADVVTPGAAIVISDSVILGTPALITLDTTNGGAVAAGANVTVTGPVDDDATVSTLRILAGTAGDVDLQMAVGATAPVGGLNVASANDVTLRAVATREAGINVTANGTVSLQGNLSTVAGSDAGSVNIEGFASLVQAAGITINTDHPTGTDGDVTLCQATGDLNVTAIITAGDGTIGLEAQAGSVSAGAALSAANLGVNATGGIDLDNVANQIASTFAASAGTTVDFRNAVGFTVGNVSATGCFTGATGVSGTDVTLRNDAGDLTVNAAITATGTVRLQSDAGNVTQNAAGTITAAALGVRAGGTVLLTAGDNDVGTFAAAAGGVVEFRDVDDLVIGQVLASGCFTMDVTGITTTDDDVLLVTGPPMAPAVDSLRLNQAIVAGNGTVRIAAQGSVSQAMAGTITAAALGVRNDSATAGTIVLDQGNDVGTFAARNAFPGGSIAYRDTNALTVGTVAASGAFAMTVGVQTTDSAVAPFTNDISLCADMGDLSLTQAVNAGSARVGLQADAGSVTQNATGTITAGALGVVAGANVDLDAATNQLADGGTFAARANGFVEFMNANGLVVGAVAAFGCFDGATGATAGGDITLCVDTGDLVLMSPLNAGGTVRLQADAGNVTQNAAGTITAAALGVRAGGTVLLAFADNDVDMLAITSMGDAEYRDVDGVAVAMVTLSGCFDMDVDGITTNGGDVGLRVADDMPGTLAINRPIVAGAGTVRIVVANANPMGAGITQAMAGAITAAALGIVSADDVMLCDAANDVDTFAARSSGPAIVVEFSDVDDLSVGQVMPAAPDNIGFLMAATGIVSGGGDVNLRAAATMTGTLSIDQAINAAAGDVRLVSATATATAVTQAMDAGTITADELGVRARGAVLLAFADNDANELAVAIETGTTADVEFRDSDSLAVDMVAAGGGCGFTDTSGITTNGGDVGLRVADDVGGTLAINQAIGAGAGTVRLVLANANPVDVGITQAPAGAVTATALGVNTADDVTLCAAANDVDAFAARSSGPATVVEFSDVDGLSIGQVTPDAPDNNIGFVTATGIVSNGGDVNLRAAATTMGTLSIDQAIGAGAGDVRLVSATATPSAVTQTMTGTVTADELGVRARGAVTLAFLDNDANTFAAVIEADAQALVELRDVDDLIVGTINAGGGCGFGSTEGIDTNGGDVSLRVADNAAGTLTVNSRIDARDNTDTARGDVRLVSATATALAVTQGGAGVISADELGVLAPGDVTLAAAVSNDARELAVNSPDPATAILVEFSDANGVAVDQVMASATNNIGFMTVTGIVTNGDDANLRTAAVGAGTLAINETIDTRGGMARGDIRLLSVMPTGTAITQDGDGTLFTDELGLEANGAALLSVAANDANTLAAETLGSFEFRNVDALTVAQVATGGGAGFTGAAGIATAGGDVNMAVGSLTLADRLDTSGNGPRDVRIVTTIAGGVAFNQTGGRIDVDELGIRGTGGVLARGDGNDISTLAVVTNGAVDVNDRNDLTVGRLPASGGTAFADFIEADGVVSNNNPINLTANRNLTVDRILNSGTNDITTRTGTGDPSVLSINVPVAGNNVTFVQGGDNDVARVTPTNMVTGTMLLDGRSPRTLPGDSLFVINVGRVIRFNPPDPVTGTGGFFDVEGGQRINFQDYELFQQINVQIFGIQTTATDAIIRAAVNFNNQVLQGNITVQGAVAVPFVLAPNRTNPVQPFAAPQVAVGDVNGDGFGDVIVGAGPGSAPLVTVVDGRAVLTAAFNSSTTAAPNVLARFFAYDPTFLGGIYVASADIDGDNKAEIITGSNAGAPAHVRTFSNRAAPGPGADIQQLDGMLGSFLPYGGFAGGVRVAAGDVNNDGRGDIVLGSGPGSGSHVKVYDGRTGGEAQSFLVFGGGFLGGIFVAAGDFDTGIAGAEILIGAGLGAPPHILVLSGVGQRILESVFAFSPTPVFLTPFPNSPVVLPGVGSLAFGGRDGGSGRLDVLVSAGRGLQSLVFRLNGRPLREVPALNLGLPFLQDPISLGGVIGNADPNVQPR